MQVTVGLNITQFERQWLNAVAFFDTKRKAACIIQTAYPELKVHQIKVKEINDRYYKDYPELWLGDYIHFEGEMPQICLNTLLK